MRHQRLQTAMEQRGLDAVVLYADAYPGRKGAVRYLFDFYLHHRFAYAMLLRGEPAELILPASLYWHLDPVRLPGDVLSHTVTAPRPIAAVAQRLGGAGVRRIGVVGLSYMPMADAECLRAQAPQGSTLLDGTAWFQRACAPRTPAERAAIRHSAGLADRALTVVAQETAAGMREAEVAALAHGAVAGEGVVDTISLMLTGGDGVCRPYFAVPGDRVLRRGDAFILLAEFCGPEGYWVETSRRFVVGGEGRAAGADGGHPPPEHLCSVELLRRMPDLLRPGARPEAVQSAIAAVARSYGLRPGHLSGHGIGLDVLERPWIADPAPDGEPSPMEAPDPAEPEWSEIPAGTVIAVHPHLVTADGAAASFIAETFLVDHDRTVPLSTLGYEIVTTQG